MLSQFLTVKRVARAVPISDNKEMARVVHVPHSEESGSCCPNLSVKRMARAVPVPYSE